MNQPESVNAPAESSPPQARPYRRLIWLVPGLVLLAVGGWSYFRTEPGGTVESITIRTREGLVGQATDTLSIIRPGTPDLYLVITHAGGKIQTKPYDDTPIGSGLTWKLPEPLKLSDVQRIEVWDDDIFLDSIEDQVAPSGGWRATGGKYEVILNGTPNAPPAWALPVGVAGAVVILATLIRFVRDQVI